LALFADDNGLSLVKVCIEQARERLEPNGYLLLEADPRQYDEIIAFAIQHDFTLIRVSGYTLTLQR
jgi:methylase of polypeptide subunit release factors